MISVDGLTLYYQQHPALEDISFDLSPGEVVGLLGRNGAGKTTLLRVLANIQQADRGTITPPPWQWHSSFLPQEPPLYPELSIEAQLMWYGQWCGSSQQEAKTQSARAMQWCDLSDRAGQPIHALSHGYQKRVGLAQCFMTSPEILLLDEPFSGLDPAQMSQLGQIITNYAKDQRIVLISSHQLSQLEQLCQRILIVHRGHLVADESQATQTDIIIHVELLGAQDEPLERLETWLTDDARIKSHRKQAQDEVTQLWITCQDDIRPAVAQQIINSKLQLLSITRQANRLESTFLTLTKS